MRYHPIPNQMDEDTLFDEGAYESDICPGVSDEFDADLATAADGEIDRLHSLITGIDTDMIPPAGYGALASAFILNIVCLMVSTGTYLGLWIQASLYFYLIYPMFPLVLILLPSLFRRKAATISGDSRDPLHIWIKNLHLIRNRTIVLQLVIRFFILSIMPLTSGMVLIYSISLLFAIILGVTGSISPLTSLLIVIQCLGILILYLDLTYLKRQFSFFVRSMSVLSSEHWIRYLLMGIGGVIVVAIASCATIILLIAILLPGITLGIYVDATNFIENRTSLWIIILWCSQFIVMQYMQSILSRRISRNICSELVSRLEVARDNLSDRSSMSASRVLRSLVLESRIHAITRSHMAGFFPTYIIGVDVGEILKVRGLQELSDMFHRK
ncbi:MAG: hypothetical protein LUQ50_05575 [Methanospirillum sp.]|uniref:hypothetical protein n=1 Tax=Methanospirillum sp. TaxID=45200 RepID=UPI002374E638|nr:hypothetical protein [Methanospirillum sp.]MDD1728521.1 hypothetical protein [Methanospirillum sp.]